MARISLKPGFKVSYRGASYEIVAAHTTTDVILRSLLDNSQVIAPVADLRSPKDLVDSSKRPPRPEEFSEDQWKIARERFTKIEPLLDCHRTAEIVSTRARETGVSSATLYRWIEMYENTGQLSVLIPATRLRGGPGKKRLPAEVETIIDNYVREEYDKDPTTSIRVALRDIKRRCRAAGVAVPHETTLRNRIKLHTKKSGVGNRPGRKRGKNAGSAEGSFPGGRFPLDVVQIDHTKLDITLVDETYRQPIGRPYITVAIDVFSRMIFGFYVSLDAPGFFSVGQTLLMGIMPKEKYLSSFGIAGPWDIYGLPKTIHSDNAPEFRSRELGIFCEEYRINLEWRPVARPNYGAHIERLVGTLNSALHELPGTTFSNPAQRGEYKSEKHAVFTVRELEEWLAKYIVEVYHNTVHSSLDMTPRQKYERGILGDDTAAGVGLPDLVDDVERMGMFLLPAKSRTVQREGVSMDRIQYFADVLRLHLNAADSKGNKTKFLFRRDPRDISKVHFYDPKLKEYFTIPYRHLGRPPISLWELREIQNRLRQEKKLRPDEDQIFQAVEGLKRIQADSAAKTKKARRSVEARSVRKAARHGDHGAEIVKGRPATANSEGMAQGGWSTDLFKNVLVTDDISMVRLDEHGGVPYDED